MQLKEELLSVLAGLGASEAEIATLVEHYTAQLVAAEAAVTTLQSNIESLQLQLVEEMDRRDRVAAGIAKFVVSTTAI